MAASRMQRRALILSEVRSVEQTLAKMTFHDVPFANVHKSERTLWNVIFANVSLTLALLNAPLGTIMK